MINSLKELDIVHITVRGFEQDNVELETMLEQVEYSHKPNCRIVSLLGALNILQTISKADEVARNFANKLDCPSIMLYAPLVVENRETKEWLMREKHIKQTFDLMIQCNIAVLGIGALTEETSIYNRGVISKDELQNLRHQSFVGDIATNLVRSDGTWDSNPLSDRLLAADLQCLKDIVSSRLIKID